MSQYKIIASDLDGTLLNKDMHVSPENFEAIRQLVAEGVLFVPASGRAMYEMPREVWDCPYARYLIHSDGAVIHDKETGESIRLSMSREKSDTVMAMLKEYDTDPSVRHCGHCYMDAKTNTEDFHRYNRMNEEWVSFSMSCFEAVENFDELCASMDAIDMVCVFFHSPEEQAECKRRLTEMGGFLIASSHEANLEIMDERAGKGSALLHLADRLGIDRSATIAVGDSPNDMDMVSKAGLGLAMGNACEELKAMAQRVICTNEEHVMVYLREHYFS